MDLVGLIPSFGNLFFTVLAFVVALSVIVAVHEYGHYIVGRWTGIHAEVFSLGFGPVLFAREDRHGTLWQVAALPFGGYVKFLGDASPASDKASDIMDELDEETRRHTMHGAPLWARAATVAAGPIFNFVLAILVFAGISLIRGEAIEPPTVAQVNPLPGEIGAVQTGDAILAIGDRPTPDYAAFYDTIEALPVTAPLPYRVRRDGTEQVVPGPYPFPPLIAAVQPDSAAIEAGLQKGDVILSIEGRPIAAFSQLQDAITSSGGRPVDMTVWRAGEVLEFTMTPRRRDLPLPDGGFDTRWLIGATGGLFFEPATATPGPVTALLNGADQTWFIMKSSLSGVYHMVTGAISACNLRGPIGIAETSGVAARQGWLSFIGFIAVLSTAVGLLNLFPIPVLDGGHLMFHAYEATTGRPPNDLALRILTGIGLGLLVALMGFALTNDLFCR